MAFEHLPTRLQSSHPPSIHFLEISISKIIGIFVNTKPRSTLVNGTSKRCSYLLKVPEADYLIPPLQQHLWVHLSSGPCTENVIELRGF